VPHSYHRLGDQYDQVKRFPKGSDLPHPASGASEDSPRDHCLKVDDRVSVPSSEGKVCRQIMFKRRLFSVAGIASGCLWQSIAVLHEEELSGEYMVTVIDGSFVQ
jgi:hypothetical protein